MVDLTLLFDEGIDCTASLGGDEVGPISSETANVFADEGLILVLFFSKDALELAIKPAASTLLYVFSIVSFSVEKGERPTALLNKGKLGVNISDFLGIEIALLIFAVFGASAELPRCITDAEKCLPLVPSNVSGTVVWSTPVLITEVELGLAL